MADLAVVILTRNETLHIARAISCVSSVAKEIFVVDSFSSDDTTSLAEGLGAMVLRNKFVNYAKQFQWALDHAPITASWVMRLDADEVIDPDLVTEIESKLPNLPSAITGINLKRKHIFLNRWIRHGGRYPLVLLRIWRAGKAHIENRWMDEHMILDEGGSITFQGGFSDHNLNNLTYFIDKHNKYASREAIDVINGRRNLFSTEARPGMQSGSRQAAVKRILKEKIYNRVPFELGALCYFLLRYVLQLGFMDGREGLAYHFLQGFWYRYLVGAKIYELEEALGNSQGEEALAILARCTGFDVKA